MNRKSQAEKAQDLLSLHLADELLVLPNVWNPLGARILAKKGFPAVATASAAIAESLGYEDGEKIKRSTLIEVLTRIANSVDVPVTVDIESGFGRSVTALKETIHQVIESGVVGINIEDSLEEGGALRLIHEQCERIAAVREVSNSQGLHLVINARVDSFLSDTFLNKEEKIADTIIRAKAYTEAGADCIYPIGPGNKDILSSLRKEIVSPINVLASPTAEPLIVLKNIGVNRVSFGPFVFRSCFKKFVDIVDSLNHMGSYECFSSELLSNTDMEVFLDNEREK